MPSLTGASVSVSMGETHVFPRLLGVDGPREPVSDGLTLFVCAVVLLMARTASWFVMLNRVFPVGLVNLRPVMSLSAAINAVVISGSTANLSHCSMLALILGRVGLVGPLLDCLAGHLDCLAGHRLSPDPCRTPRSLRPMSLLTLSAMSSDRRPKSSSDRRATYHWRSPSSLRISVRFSGVIETTS